MDRETIETRLRDVFAASARGATAVYLFGSVARGTASQRSDVDVAVLLAEDPPRTLAGLRLDLEDDLREHLGEEVQLVVLNRAPVDLVHRVLRDGRLLMDRDPSRRIAFEVRARREYFDLLPVLRQYRGLEAPAVTDAELVAKKLAQIETFVAELRRLGQPQRMADDPLQERFIEHTLQIAIQAALDVASHIVSDDRLGEPASYRALFELLARHGWVSDALVPVLRDMVGFRNIVVHGYGEVNLDIVRDIAENHLGDLLDFVAQIRRRLA